MSDEVLREQSLELVSLLPRLMRRLGRIDLNDPAVDIPSAQMRVCGVLRDGPRNMSCISRELGISLSALTQLADRLERAGMVERVAESEDRRTKSLQLTARGLEIMQARREKRLARALEILKTMSPEDCAAAVRAIRTLVEASIAATPEVTDNDVVTEQLTDQ